MIPCERGNCRNQDEPPNGERWLVSRCFDLLFIIFSSGLLIVPHLFATGGVSNVVVDLIVTALIGGPHLFATFTMTFMEPRFRKRYPVYTWGSLLMPVVVVTLAVINLALLVTVFFFWASVHVIHQALYIADSYRNKDSRWSPQTLTRWRRLSRLIDYGLLFTSIYPIATFKFTGTPLHVGPIHIISEGLETRRQSASLSRIPQGRLVAVPDHRRLPDAARRLHRQDHLGGPQRAVSRSQDAPYECCGGPLLRYPVPAEPRCCLRGPQRVALVPIPGGGALSQPPA